MERKELIERLAELLRLPDPMLPTNLAAIYCCYESTTGVRDAINRGELRPDGRRGKTYMFRKSTLDAFLASGLEDDPALSQAQNGGRNNGKSISGNHQARARNVQGQGQSQGPMYWQRTRDPENGEGENNRRSQPNPGGLGFGNSLGGPRETGADNGESIRKVMERAASAID